MDQRYSRVCVARTGTPKHQRIHHASIKSSGQRRDARLADEPRGRKSALSGAALNILLLNDTANVGHVGCVAVADAHARMLGRRGHRVVHRCFLGELARLACPDADTGRSRALADNDLMRMFDEVDAVVVNGEGTIHHGAGTEYLHVLGAASSRGKRTLLVNCVLEEVVGFDEVLHALDDITVRDLRSQRFLAGRGIASRLVYDSFLEAGFTGPPVADLQGRVVVTDWHHSRDPDVGQQLLQYLRGVPQHTAWFLPFLSRDIAQAWQRIPATLAHARAVVTGRHHGVYAAALAGVPFVAMSGNTHKIDGLIDGFPNLAFCLNPPSIQSALEEATERREEFRAAYRTMLAARPLSTFDALGASTDLDGERRELAQLADDCHKHASAFEVDLAYRVERRSLEMCLRPDPAG